MSELLTPPQAGGYDPRSYIEAGSAYAPRDDGEVTLASLVLVLTRHARLVVLTPVVLAVLTVTVGLLAPRTWSSDASLILTSRPTGAASGLSGLAASFGVTMPTGEATQTPAFYSDLIRSREILGAIIDSGLVPPRGGARVQVADLYEVRGDTPALRRANALRALNDNLSVQVSTKTGVVRLSVRAPEAWASKQLVDRVLAEVGRFNMQTRQSQAAAERRFAERRLAQIRAELATAEARFRDFLQGNRIYSAPTLSFERDRLQREVFLRQELFATMSQSYERARIDEVRDTPVFTVVEQPEVPPRPDTRGLLTKGILSLVAGGVLGALLAFVVEFVRGLRGTRLRTA